MATCGGDGEGEKDGTRSKEKHHEHVKVTASYPTIVPQQAINVFKFLLVLRVRQAKRPHAPGSLSRGVSTVVKVYGRVTRESPKRPDLFPNLHPVLTIFPHSWPTLSVAMQMGKRVVGIVDVLDIRAQQKKKGRNAQRGTKTKKKRQKKAKKSSIRSTVGVGDEASKGWSQIHQRIGGD